MKKNIIVAFWALALTSCQYLKKETAEDALARVGDHYLERTEVLNRVSGTGSKEDSLIRLRNYVEDWATNQLLLDRAVQNLSPDRQQELEDLVTQYRSDLLINAYKEALVERGMDTSVSDSELLAFYEQNKQNFRLNEELYTLRYLSVTPDFSDLDKVREKFRRNSSDDREDLKEMALKFRFYSFDDSTWIKGSEIIKKIPALTTENKDQYLKKSQFFELSDSLGVYLVAVKEVMNRNESAPLTYIRPTLRNIILNRRKLEFMRRLESDLLQEAIRKKQFEYLDPLGSVPAPPQQGKEN